jgi:hypothetical protein
MGRKGYTSHVATLAAAAVFKDFVALHMTWGALNELTTLTGYHRLIARTEHPVLVEMLQRIVKDERRHFAFYRSQARMRLARSAQARKVTRWAMEHLWAPVGTGVRPQEETDFVIGWLFGDEEGRASAMEIDRTMAELPGFEGTRLARDALRGTLRRLESRVQRPRWYAHRPWNGQRSSWPPDPPPSLPTSLRPREHRSSTTAARATASSFARSPTD